MLADDTNLYGFRYSLIDFHQKYLQVTIFRRMSVLYCKGLDDIKLNAGDNIDKNETNGACSSDGRGQRRIQDFGGETRGKETTRKTRP